MSFRNTGILLIVLLVVGGAVLWLNRQGGTETDAGATPTPAPLTAFFAPDVTSITVEQGERSITVERAGGDWRIAGDNPQPADESEVTQALDRLTSLRPGRTLDDVADFGDFGLVKPAWSITLKPEQDKPVVFHIGDENPQGTARYLRVTGTALVHLVPRFAVEDVLGWLDNPPYPPTPTPEPTETPAETPTPEATPQG